MTSNRCPTDGASEAEQDATGRDPLVTVDALGVQTISGAPIIEDVSFSVAAGEALGIVGETGSGKSTLANLLLRLYEPPDRTIFIDAVDIKQIARGELEKAIGYVSQDIFLFFGSVQENILLGMENGDSGALEEAARITQLLPTIQTFGGGFETVIGERGVRLSGGQKQRTALARAIIKDPPILILDDAFSSVDAETEEEILRDLRRFMRGRTTLLISHRISSVRHADQIIYLRHGEVVEQGTHDELLARRGAYYELYRHQALIHEVETMGRTEGHR